ncbi:MAG: IS110 family RNA-guided transposase [Planctomycetota bacterium]|jgi:transposase
MKTRLSKKQEWFKKITLTKDDEIYVGIDVHKRSHSVAIWLNDTPAIDFVMPADNKKLVELLEKLRIAIKMIVYEAGPMGYNLARLLKKASFPVKVIAPSKTPRQSARDSKTDRLDCRTLAKYAAKGLLRPIAIPTTQQEADRQLTRAREQLVTKQTRIKLQIKSFLLQHGLKEPAGLKSWSKNAVNKLKNINLSKPLRFSLDILLEELHFIQTQIRKTTKLLEETFAKKRHAPNMKVLLTHPGIGPVIARQFAAEIFNPGRFKDKTELAKYVGLSPTIFQSGQSLRDGPITKSGRPQLRSNLIEAAWIWIRRDPTAYKVYKRILLNTGEKNKAVTAMARRLAIHLWKMSCDNKPYITAV